MVIGRGCFSPGIGNGAKLVAVSGVSGGGGDGTAGRTGQGGGGQIAGGGVVIGLGNDAVGFGFQVVLAVV